MTWQIFQTSGKGRVPVPLYGTEGKTESATIIAFLKARDRSAGWWASQKQFSCRKVSK